MQWRVAAWTHPADPNGFEQREHSIPFVRFQGNDPEEPRGRCTITVPEGYAWQNLISVQDPSNPADTSLIRLYRAGQANDTPPDVEYLLQRFQKVVTDDGTAAVELYGVDWRLAALDTTVVRWWDWEPGATTSEQPDWEYGGPNILGDGFENVGTAPDVWELFVEATGGTLDLGPAGDLQTLDFDASDSAVETALQSTTEITDANVEKEANVNTSWTLTIDATGGTFNISDGTDDADPAWNVSDTDLETALEGFASITSVSVTDEGGGVYTIELLEPTGGVELTVDGANLTGGAGTATIEYASFGNAYRITMVQPSFGVTLQLDAAALTGSGALATLRRVETGQFETGSWTKARQVSEGTPFTYGGYAFFGVTDEQAHTGSQSLKIDPEPIDTHGRYPGAQVVASVTPGSIYQASIWVRTTSSNDKYRFVLRTLWGDTLYLLDGSIATDTGALGGTSYTAGTWHEVTINDIVIPPGVDQIIFRFSNVDAEGNPSAFYLDDPYLARGLQADTIGKISQDLIADAQTDHAPTLVRLPYLTEGDYTATLDETGEAWVRDESITLRRGKKYGTHIYGQQFRELGYDYDVTPGRGAGESETEPTAANWYLRLYNPGNLGTVHTDIGFVVGFGVTGGLIAGRTPRATRWLAEGKGGIITEVVDTAQEAETGIVEDYIGDDDITDATSLAARAQQELDSDLANKLALTAELDDTGPIPYADFTRGDTARFLYAGLAVAHTRRISEISLEANTTDGETIWKASVTASRIFRKGQALKEAVYRLLTEYDRLPNEPEEGPVTVTAGGGGMAHVLIVSDSEPAFIQEKADHVVPEADSSAPLQQVFDRIDADQGSQGTWTIWMAGVFDLDGDVTAPSRAKMRGLGSYRTSGCVA